MGERYVRADGLADVLDQMSENAESRTSTFGLARSQRRTITALGHAHCRRVPRLVRGCVACWLGNSCPEFATVAVLDFDAPRQTQFLERAAAALIGVNCAQNGCEWVTNQVASLRAERAELPIILLVEPDDTGRADALAHQLNIQGYIPRRAPSQSLRRLCAWLWPEACIFQPLAMRAPGKLAASRMPQALSTIRLLQPSLPPARGGGSSVLASGAQNKIIAYQLSMSLRSP